MDSLRATIDDQYIYENNSNSTHPRSPRRRKRFLSYPRYVELMVTADAKMVRHHGRNLEHYILTIMSVVSKIMFLKIIVSFMLKIFKILFNNEMMLAFWIMTFGLMCPCFEILEFHIWHFKMALHIMYLVSLHCGYWLILEVSAGVSMLKQDRLSLMLNSVYLLLSLTSMTDTMCKTLLNL